MATFRKYGGTNFSPISNIVRHNMLNSKSSSFNTSGLFNTKETFLSHVDMSGNSLLHVGNIFFQDGTSISSASTLVPPTLASVLNNGNTASTNIAMNNYPITDLSYLQFHDNKVQTTSYTGWQPSADTSYNSATLTFDTNGRIIKVIDNSLSPFGLADVLTKSGNGGGKSMTNLGSITQTGSGSNSLNETTFGGNIIQNGDGKIINQSGNGTNQLKMTNFYGNITQSSGTNTLNATQFNGNITQSSGTNTLNATQFNGNITQNGGSITQTLPGTNILNDTSFTSVCSYTTAPALTNVLDIPYRGYVDTIASGLSPVPLCNCATTGDISLSGIYIPASIDDVSLSNQMRVLVKSQKDYSNSNISTSDPSNGIYVYYSGPPSYLTRADDCSLGQNVTNQLTFISDGSLNGMKAFVQDISTAIVGTNNLEYVPFYSLNYNLGQGLELVGGSTLQVKSKLTDFIKELSITRDTSVNGFLIMNSTYESSNGVSIIYQDKNLLIFDNNSDTSSYSNDSFKFACNNFGTDASQTTPLTFNSSLFTIDLSNNSANSIVKYQACNNSIHSIPIGHNFTGKLNINNAGGTNNPPLRILRSDASQMLHLTNLNGTDYNNIVQTGDNAIISYKPLSIAHQGSVINSGIRIDISNVRLRASNTNYYDLSLSTGHNFYGNVFLNTPGSYLQFPDGTKQYSAAYSSIIYGPTLTASRTGSNSFNNLYSSLNSSYIYHMSGIIYIIYDGGGGGSGGSITYSIEFRSGSGGLYNVLSSNSNSVINYKLTYLNIPYSFITTGYTDLDIQIDTQDVNGTWSTVGTGFNKCVRI